MKSADTGCHQPARTHHEKRRSIVDAAADVFCRVGFAGANIDMIAAEAGVSRQTIYNHHSDKENLFAAVVRETTERCNASLFATLATFPDHPADLEKELVAFAVRLTRNCLCNREGKFLNKLIQAEGERYPQLFQAWREHGPGRVNAALGARFARLAHAGYLDVDDPDLAARQFLALVYSDFQMSTALGAPPTDEELENSARAAVRTFLRAYGPRTESSRPGSVVA